MAQPDLVTLSDPRSAASEAYRTLRTNLEFSSLDHPLRSLLVTSPSANADKSITLANLAAIMAEGGRKVILVDADLRKPVLHQIFGVENQVGLSEMIGAQGFSEQVPVQETAVPGLGLVTSGKLPQNPSILIGSAQMDQAIATLSELADLVLFSAPPIIAVTDAALLAAKVDGTLLVVRAGSTQRVHVEQAQALLAKVSARLVGATLVNASIDSSVSNYYK